MVGRFTTIENDYVEKVGGISAIRSALPMDWFGLCNYGIGLVIQGGAQPDAAPTYSPMPARGGARPMTDLVARQTASNASNDCCTVIKRLNLLVSIP